MPRIAWFKASSTVPVPSFFTPPVAVAAAALELSLGTTEALLSGSALLEGGALLGWLVLRGAWDELLVVVVGVGVALVVGAT